MRAVVAGYHTIGCLGLEALLRHGFDVRLVLTHHDDPGETIWWRSLAATAERAGIPVERPGDPAGKAFRDRIVACEPDFLFSFYYRRLIPTEVLRLARVAALNLHGSLLPHYRGRAPVNWALVNGETVTGVSLHHMTAGADEGDLVDQERVPIGFADTAFTLYGRLHEAAVRLLDRTLPELKAGTARRTPQRLERGSYYGARRPEDGRIDWNQPGVAIYNLIRAVTHPYPGAFTQWNGAKLLIWWALPVAVDPAPGVRGAAAPGTVLAAGNEGITIATGGGALRLVTVQFEGEPEQPAASLGDAGAGPSVGDRLGR